MVDWVLIMAFPDITHICKVKLTGCVKKLQKEEWQQMLENEYQGLSHDFNYDTGIHKIFTTPADKL